MSTYIFLQVNILNKLGEDELLFFGR